MQKTIVKPISYTLIALLIFSLLGLEFLIFFLSRLVDGRAASQIFSWPVNWYGAVFHWTVTIIVWAAGAAIIYGWVNKKGVQPELFRVNINKRDGIIIAVGIVFVVAYELLYSRMVGLSIPQIWREFRGFQNMYVSQAWIVAIFQNLYYLAEFVLVVMMVAFFQRAGELWFKSSWFPWGGIGLALTWGSIHLVTNPQGAVGVMVWAILMGIFFVFSKKSFFATWLIGVLGFLI